MQQDNKPVIHWSKTLCQCYMFILLKLGIQQRNVVLDGGNEQNTNRGYHTNLPSSQIKINAR
jgi:hypothetical protein